MATGIYRIEAKSSDIRPNLDIPYQRLDKDNQVSKLSRSILPDIALGIGKSKITKAILISSVSLATLFLLSATPPAWIISAVAIGSFISALLLQAAHKKGKQKLLFELSVIGRFFKKNSHEIPIMNPRANLYLGSLPNRTQSEGEKLSQIGVESVVSINEPWEREPLGLSLPYRDKDWKELGVKSIKKMDVLDHSLVDMDKLNEAADFINESLLSRKSVFVHCRAGKGRSAMLIAAYLIKYQGMTALEACRHIKQYRPCSSIMKKVEHLKKYARSDYIEDIKKS